MISLSLRLAVVVVSGIAVFGAACGDAQEGHAGRSAPPTSAFGPGKPASAPKVPSAAKPAAAPASAAVQPDRKIDPPARFASAILELNAARADAGAKPLAWSTGREAEAQAAVKSASALTCSRQLAERMSTSSDVASYWAPSSRLMDGSNAAQDLSASFIVSEWLQERQRYSAAAGCDRKGACENYSRLIRPAARSVGCAIAICSDRSQVWACRFGE